MISRRKTREYLLQLLYAKVSMWSAFDRDIFFAAYFSTDHQVELDTAYIENLQSAIIDHEKELLSLIRVLAPKFEIETLPLIHILILMIALGEMLYFSLEKIPESVSVNEAVELAKRFSDAQGKNLINGALSTFLKDRDILNGLSIWEYAIFSKKAW